MLIEFTSRTNTPIYITPEEVAALDSKRSHTIIYLKSGVKLSVQESASEVSKDLNNSLQDKIMEIIANANGANF